MMDEDENDSLAGGSHDPSLVMSTMINFNFSYIINTWFGRVKVLQLIFCLLAGCILPSAVPMFFTRFSFFTFVVWTCFMYIIVDLMIHVTSLSKMLPSCCITTDIMMYPLFIGALALLISCSLVASVADLYVWHAGSRTTRTGFSAAFGFILMILFLVEAFLYYKRSRSGDSGTAGSRVPRSSDDDFENGNIRGGPSIVISRPILQRTEESPPPYHEKMKNDPKGGSAVPIGSYGGDTVDY